MFNPWLDLSLKAFQVGLKTQSVVALRMMQLASGGAAPKQRPATWCPKRLQLLSKCESASKYDPRQHQRKPLIKKRI
jgi:hypothetical protein